jgi:predicted nucleic acid-binding protein
MAVEPSYLVDTNILLRLSKQDDPNHGVVQAAVDGLTKRGAQLCYTAQNISEFWNVCTRPASHNGFGLSIRETDMRVQAIELIMTLLPDNEKIYRVWRQLVVRNSVSGVQVHDARLAAAMQVHGVSHILTLNQPDFTRYASINVMHPANIPA